MRCVAVVVAAEIAVVGVVETVVDAVAGCCIELTVGVSSLFPNIKTNGEIGTASDIGL